MSKIKLFGLGGLNEFGKNMYVVEVDEDIFIFDAGLKYADNRMLGIDYVIPNFEYIKKNKKKVKGIFLTHGHDENIGAIPNLLNEIDVPIYASHFTIEVLKTEISNEKKHINLHEIKAHKKIAFGNNSVFPVAMTHSIPDALGFVLNTEDGAIFYTGDFTFDATMKDFYKTDMGKLAYIGKQGVLCLLSESIYAEKKGHTSPNHRIAPIIKDVLNKNDNRIIISASMYSIYRLQELFDEVALTNRKVVIMGKTFQNFIKKITDEGYLKINKNIIGSLNNVEDKNAIILIPDQRENALAGLTRIVNGYDKFIKLTKNDTVFVMENIYDSMERQYVKLSDKIAKLGANVISLNKRNLLLHASREDLLLILDLMNPKYYMPVKGEYRYQFANAKLATHYGLKDENIILKGNGEIVLFENGELKECFDKVNSDSVLIDGTSPDDVSEVVLRDREILSDSGIVMISVTLDKKTKKIVAGPEIVTRGFIYVKNNQEIMKEIEKQAIEIIKENISNNYVEYKKIREAMREKIGKYLQRQTGVKPMLINVINEV